MSKNRVKTKYLEDQGTHEEERTLYAIHNNSCDIVSIYYDTGEYLLSFSDTQNNNLLDAITRIGGGIFKKEDNKFVLIDDVEYMTSEELLKIKM